MPGPQRYFRLMDDGRIRGRWFLKSPVGPSGEELDPRLFTKGQRYAGGHGLRLPQRREGRALDFTLADFDMPVASARAAELLGRYCGDSVQLVPVAVEGEAEPFAIVNVLATCRCIDEKRSDFDLWTEEDERPDRLGQYRMFSELKVDAARVPEGSHLFRLEGWLIALVVSEQLQAALKAARLSGLLFEEL